MNPPKDVTTANLSAYFQALLKLYSVLHWKEYLGGVRRAGIGRTPNPKAGFPDWGGVTERGRMWAAEIKGPGDRLSDKQKEWIIKLEANRVLTATLDSYGAIVDFVQRIIQN